MAPRVIKLREQEPAEEPELERLSQRKRPEVGRYLLQVGDLRTGLDGAYSGYSVRKAKKVLGFEANLSLVD